MNPAILTPADLKKIKQALYDLAVTEPYMELMNKVGEDMDEIAVMRANAKKNLSHYQQFIEERGK